LYVLQCGIAGLYCIKVQTKNSEKFVANASKMEHDKPF
jgi:hypothetical protein